MEDGLKIDIGCGSNKREGFIGIDYAKNPGVDFVLDLTNDPLPFGDRTVDHVFSSHFLEHVHAPNHIFSEIGRVCRDGAKIEIWTPYAFSNEAFMYGHVTYLTEEHWNHFCYLHRDYHLEMLKGRWVLQNINYVISEESHAELKMAGFPIEFAIKYFKSVVLEFGVEIRYNIDLATPANQGSRTYSYSREGVRSPVGNSLEAILNAANEKKFVNRVYRFGQKLIGKVKGRV